MFKSTKSLRDLSPSFDLPFMSSKIPMMLSHTFFSMCMTSIAWRMSRSFQYGRYLKKIESFLNPVPVWQLLCLIITLNSLLPLLSSPPTLYHLLPKNNLDVLDQFE